MLLGVLRGFFVLFQSDSKIVHILRSNFDSTKIVRTIDRTLEVETSPSLDECLKIIVQVNSYFNGKTILNSNVLIDYFIDFSFKFDTVFL